VKKQDLLNLNRPSPPPQKTKQEVMTDADIVERALKMYHRLHEIYVDKNEIGEGERRHWAYNVLIKEWQTELSKEQMIYRSELKSDNIKDSGEPVRSSVFREINRSEPATFAKKKKRTEE
jgi:hypothetical protein